MGKQSVGVTLEDDQIAELNRLKRRWYDDDRLVEESRSAALREVLAVGLAATKVIEDSDVGIDLGPARQHTVRQAVLDHLDDEQ